MGLTAGTHLASYEIIELLGSGGMGEVYRARDLELGRNVAIKVLRTDLSLDPDRLGRFHQEAKATAALNHPNILSIFHIGQNESSPYLVSELLEGQTLRQALRDGALSIPKSIDYASQIGQGLAAAHARGIVHRDLKPENIFITRDGRAKILDFGLAKLVEVSKNEIDDSTRTRATGAGIVLGTAGYMSPEQIRGATVDHRSDIFSFGVVLYEMLSGKRAFDSQSSADLMAAILREEPETLSSRCDLPPFLAKIVHHCLEKDPDFRFQAMQDLVFDINSSFQAATIPSIPTPRANFFRKNAIGLSVSLLTLLLIGGAGFVLGRRQNGKSEPVWRRLTFGKGWVTMARFAPDRQSVVYSATWRGEPNQIFMTRPEGPESRSLGIENTTLLAVSPRGEILALQKMQSMGLGFFDGTLSRIPLEGGAPREVLEDTQFADWDSTGKDLLVVHQVAGKSVLEFPLGHALLESNGLFAHPRLSPKSDMVAFFEYRDRVNDGGNISVVEKGNRRILSSGWSDLTGLAWSPDGGEIWFSGSRVSGAGTLNAISLDGRERIVAKTPSDLVLLDIASDGRVLLTTQNWRGESYGAFHGEKEQDLTWFDFTLVDDLSDDGNLVLFHEAGEAAGPDWSAYSRIPGSLPVRLTAGICGSVSRTTQMAVCFPSSSTSRSGAMALVPLGAGVTKTINIDGASGSFDFVTVQFFPEGNRVFAQASEGDHGMRGYVVTLQGSITPITPEGINWARLSPSGKRVAANFGSNQIVLYSTIGAAPYTVPGVIPGDYVTGWSQDEGMLYVGRHAEMPSPVFRLDIKTGKRVLWKLLAPPDLGGVNFIEPVFVAPDGKSYVYSLNRRLTDLFIVEGLH